MRKAYPEVEFPAICFNGSDSANCVVEKLETLVRESGCFASEARDDWRE